MLALPPSKLVDGLRGTCNSIRSRWRETEEFIDFTPSNTIECREHRMERWFILPVPAGAPMFRILDIDHLVLRVVDVERMIRFYCDALGCTVERREEEIGLVQLRVGRSLLDLVPVDGKLGRAGGGAPVAAGRNLDHFCLRIEPFDETSIRRQLDRHGITAGPVETRYGAEGEGPSMYLADPEGNVVELKGPLANR